VETIRYLVECSEQKGGMMERWTFFRDPMSSGCDCGMEKDIDGEWVGYEDHVEEVAKLETENNN